MTCSLVRCSTTLFGEIGPFQQTRHETMGQHTRTSPLSRIKIRQKKDLFKFPNPSIDEKKINTLGYMMNPPLLKSYKNQYPNLSTAGALTYHTPRRPS